MGEAPLSPRDPAEPPRPRVRGLPGRRGASAAFCSRPSRDVAHAALMASAVSPCAFGHWLIHSLGSMCRPPAAALGQDAGGQGRGEGRGGHRRRDTLDRVWHYAGFAARAWTLQGKQLTQKVPAPRASVSPSENEVYPSGSEAPGSGPRPAPPPGALDTRRGREEGARAPWRRPGEGRAPAARLCGGRHGHVFHG